MTSFQRYLAEEVAVDHADGLIPRREALRRLGLLGLALPAAGALLAACATGQESAATSVSTSSASAAASPAGPPPLATVAGFERPALPGRTGDDPPASRETGNGTAIHGARRVRSGPAWVCR